MRTTIALDGIGQLVEGRHENPFELLGQHVVSDAGRRALAVRAYLIGLGIDGARIQTRSYGEEQPLDARRSEDAWRLNRRVEFVFYR